MLANMIGSRQTQAQSVPLRPSAQQSKHDCTQAKASKGNTSYGNLKRKRRRGRSGARSRSDNTASECVELGLNELGEDTWLDQCGPNASAQAAAPIA